MKVAIHKPDFSGSFAQKWIEYCTANKIDFYIVDCLDTEIIKTLKENKTTHLLWHFSQIWKDLLTARNILYSAEMIGIKVFPNKYTSWHFDDKVSQKYLLEATGIDMAKSYVFYDKRLAKKWINEISKYPVVAKLRRGSGSTSVKLLKSSKQLIAYSNKMFSRGISPQSSITHDFVKRTRYLKSWNDFRVVLKKVYDRIFNNLFGYQIYPRELGYIYLQEFIKENNFDIRIVVIGDRAYGIKRMVRKNDFRASGSGNIVYDVSQININCVKKAFEISIKLKTQTIAIDFVIDEYRNPLVIEISYGFSPRAYDYCEGYWDIDLTFHKGSNILEYIIIEEFLKEVC
jgi:glutathione synthase/RimK-type ligase-like ATP-grasp enzyme